MIAPNRLSAPGERAALDRVELVVERVDEVDIGQLAPSPMSMLAPDERGRLVEELEAEADRCGRRQLLGDVCDRVQGSLVTRLSSPVYRAAAYPLSTRAAGRADDQARTVTAILDAVSVALLEDRLDERTAARLSAPGRTLLGLPPLGDPDPPGVVAAPIAEPSAEDWVEAASGDARIGGYSPLPVGARVAFAILAAMVFTPAAVFSGVVQGEIGVGVLAGIAVVAVCWLVATYRR